MYLYSNLGIFKITLTLIDPSRIELWLGPRLNTNVTVTNITGHFNYENVNLMNSIIVRKQIMEFSGAIKNYSFC